MTEAKRDAVPADLAAEEELPAVAQKLAAIVGMLKTTRGEVWESLRRSPLVNGVEDLTSVHGPFALDADQARCVKDIVEMFSELFPEAYDELRLCSTTYGLDRILDMLATADIADAARRAARRDAASVGAEVRRYFARERDEGIAPYRRRPKRKTGWVV